MKLTLRMLALFAIVGSGLFASRTADAVNGVPGVAALIASGTVNYVQVGGGPLLSPAAVNVFFSGPEAPGQPGWIGTANVAHNGTSVFNSGFVRPELALVMALSPTTEVGSVAGYITYNGQPAQLYITCWRLNGTQLCNIDVKVSGVSVVRAGAILTGLLFLEQ